MEIPTDKSVPDFSSVGKNIRNAKVTNKDIRENYFNQLRSWLITVNNYQCYYNKLQQDSLQKLQKVSKNTTEVPREVPNSTIETSSDSNQFVGMFSCIMLIYC